MTSAALAYAVFILIQTVPMPISTSKTIRISRVAAVGTNSESKRYPPRKKGNSPLTGERGERKDQLKAPGTHASEAQKPMS